MTAPAPSPGRFPQQSFEALANFRYALRCFLSFSEIAAGDAGLSPQQYQTLLAIKGSGEGRLGIKDIAARLLIRHHTAVELVGRLEENGFVTRRKCSVDARRVVVQHTAKADRIMDGLAAAHMRELKNIRPVLEQLMEQFGSRKRNTSKGRKVARDTKRDGRGNRKLA